MTLVADVCLGLLAIAAVLCVVRLARSRSLADRIVALDSLLIVIVNGIAVYGIRAGSGVYVNVLVVTALLSFVGTVAVARYLERRGA